MKRWDCNKHKRVEETSITAYLNEVIEIGKKHGFSISHEDTGGGFEVVNFSESTNKWLMDASINIKEIK